MFLQELSRNATLAAFQQELSFQHPDFLFPLCLAWTNLPREKARWEGRRCTHSAHPVRSVSHEEARRTAVQSGAVCLLSSALPAPLPTHTHASTHARMHTLNYHTKPSSMLRPGEHFSAYRLIARSSPNKAQRQHASNNARTAALKKKKKVLLIDDDLQARELKKLTGFSGVNWSHLLVLEPRAETHFLCVAVVFPLVRHPVTFGVRSPVSSRAPTCGMIGPGTEEKRKRSSAPPAPGARMRFDGWLEKEECSKNVFQLVSTKQFQRLD